MNRSGGARLRAGLAAAAAAALFGAAPAAQATQCGTGSYPFPFTDVAGVGDAFCNGILQAYVTGITRGTTSTTFSPNDLVPRVQMTTFLQRSMDQNLRRNHRRAALGQWWTTQSAAATQAIDVGAFARYCASDGQYLWVPAGSSVHKIEASTGTIVGTWTGATNARRVVVAAGKVFVTGRTLPGSLYVIDPTQPPGPVALAATVGNDAVGLAFDGARLWTTNAGGSVSIVTVQTGTPFPVTTVTVGLSAPTGIVYDGRNVWVTENGQDQLLKLDANGAVVQTIATGDGPGFPVYDGANLWVPNEFDGNVTVVNPATGAIVATIPANVPGGPTAAAFDGERILLTDQDASVSVFRAADLSHVATVSLGAGSQPYGACSDGINFWVTLAAKNQVVRF